MEQHNIEQSFGLEPELHEIFQVDDEAVLSPEEISEMIGMHVESVRRWCRSGKIDSYCFGGKYIIIGSNFKSFMKKARVKSKATKKIIQ
jgi:excisionase family DNA binding protein